MQPLDRILDLCIVAALLPAIVLLFLYPFVLADC